MHFSIIFEFPSLSLTSFFFFFGFLKIIDLLVNCLAIPSLLFRSDFFSTTYFKSILLSVHHTNITYDIYKIVYIKNSKMSFRLNTCDLPEEVPNPRINRISQHNFF